MIIVCIRGGLGNQMFQYAAGYSLSQRTGSSLKFDVSYFTRKSKEGNTRSYALNALGINRPFSSKMDLGLILVHYLFRTITSGKYGSQENRSYLFKEQFNRRFDSRFLEIQTPVILKGYWESYKYFECYSENLRKEFLFPPLNQSGDLWWQSEILGSTSATVGVHIRRGDKVPKGDPVKEYDLLQKKYYQEAMAIISSKMNDPVFFIFSDDIQWCRDNITPQSTTHYVSLQNEKKPWIDMYLLHLCQHNVIGNSTFSWWAAWLNQNPGKIVIAPTWFSRFEPSPYDMYPPDWIVL
ncbi:MAG: alpha-1,2-fucosyltransferase [Gloeomargaritaceae cyanobacterium C42_A2020_066]|nr:alpha-1,2-fucosyltransferase [Gloeomargaritaceae cyanobacterium C42_A2020_066]